MTRPDTDGLGSANEPGLEVGSNAEAIEPVLERLPAEQRDAILAVVEQRLSHSGPLPPPAQLREYDEVLPGLAERIVRLTEKEQRHRHDLLDLAVRRDARLRDRGQALGMIALILTLAFCWLLIEAGRPEIAGAVASVLVVGVVSIFVLGRRADLEEAERARADEE